MKGAMLLVAMAALSIGARDGAVVTPDGATIHVIEAGKGPAILFVPGWTIPADIFELQLAHFSAAG